VSYLRTAHERAAYERTFYPGTETLVNKLDIRDPVLLEQAERAITSRRAREGLPTGADCRSYEGFKAIHRHLFQDLYAWAGEERTYTTARGPIPFAVPEHIAPWMEKQFAELARLECLQGTTPAEFAAGAGRIVNEINAAHPFVDGNGRCQRFWLRQLANGAGFDLTFHERQREAWNEASRVGFEHSEHGPMIALLQSTVVPLEREQVRERQWTRSRAREDDGGRER
jgi:cell filamentation protein